jgi:poly(3-hydroxybutyrate) depolymerase
MSASLSIAKAAVKEGAHYWSRLPGRGFPPLTVLTDTARWVQLMSDRRPPTWSSPHTVVFTTPIARLRDFSDGATDDVLPTLFLPPQAGHDSCIVDFSPQQSQVRTARAAGLTRLFSLDWVGATPQSKDATIEDYIAVIDRAVDHLGGRANLVGDCQGGWLATIYTALRPHRVHTLTIAGAPIDFHAGQPPIGEWVNSLGGNDLAFYRGLVAKAGGVLPGKHMLDGFILLKPESELEKNLQLFSHLDDDEHIARYREFEDWFKHVQDIPGTFYLWIISHLFRDNQLVQGKLVVGGQTVDLGRITCPLNLLAGATDHITPPAQVFAAADHVSTPREDITTATTSGGHLGLFMGSEALRDFWPSIFVDVAARSAAQQTSIDEAEEATAPHDPLVPAP